MAERFLDVPIQTDEQALADAAVQVLVDHWPDYEPNDGDPEVIQIEAVAPMAANAAQVAALVPAAIFRKYGTDLAGVPYSAGAQAQAVVRFTAVDTEGYVVPDGTEIDLDGWSFTTDDAAPILAGEISAEVGVTASLAGVGPNDLPGDVVSPLSSLSFVDLIEVVTPSSGGADEETDAAYIDRLSRELELQARTLVTPRDYELMALSDPGVGRVLALHDGARRVKVVAVDHLGEPLEDPIKERLVARFDGYRLVNTVVDVDDPTYTTVNVTYEVVAYAGFDTTDLLARIDAALADVLNPLTWGLPLYADLSATSWSNQPVVRKNKLIDLIGSVNGVDFVNVLTLTGSAGTVDGDGDLRMPGTVPLVRSGTFTGSVVAAD